MEKFFRKLTFILATAAIFTVFCLQPGLAFSPEMGQFIREGKQIRLQLFDNINQFTCVPEEEVEISSIMADDTLILQQGEKYMIKTGPSFQQVYMVQVLATGDPDRAREIKTRLTGQGYSDIEIIKEDNFYKVRVGKFQLESEARKLEEQLRIDGWQTWVRTWRIEEDLSGMGIYNIEGELLARGTNFILEGNLNLDGRLYQGFYEFLYSGNGITIYNTTGLNTILYGLLPTIPDSDQEYIEILKALTVLYRTDVIRAKLAGNYEGFLKLPNYQGAEAGYSQIKAVNETDGEIFSWSDRMNRINVQFTSNDLAGILALVEEGLDYREILRTLAAVLEVETDLKIIDLSEQIEQRALVEAEVTSGLKYKEIRQLTWWGPRVITLLDLNMDQIALKTAPYLARGQIPGLEDLADMLKREQALAGINGGYFNYTGKPLGFMMKEGQVISEPIKGRTVVAWTECGKVIIDHLQKWQGILNGEIVINGVNREVKPGEIVVFNKYYGEQTPGGDGQTREIVVSNNSVVEIRDKTSTEGTPIPGDGFIIQARGEAREKLQEIVVGEPISLEDDFYPDFWDKEHIVSGLGAGPRLLEGGKLNITGEEEEFQNDILLGRAPRSALGITPDRHLILVTVDGRQPDLSIGITLENLALFMQDYGVIDALNLDGGGSARMVVRSFTMSNPSAKRLLSSGLLIKFAGNLP